MLLSNLLEAGERGWVSGMQTGDGQNTGSPQDAKVKIIVPRMELVAAVMSLRLVKRVKEFLRIPVEGVRYFTTHQRSWQC